MEIPQSQLSIYKKRKIDDYIPETDMYELPTCLTEDVPQESKEINYGSLFFRKDIIERFNADINTISIGNSTLLNRYKLYNGDDLINFISLCPGPYTRGFQTADRFLNYRNTFLNKIKHELALLCSDINESYGERSIQRSLGGDINNNYDIVVLADPNVMEDTRLHTVKVDDPNLGDKWLKRKKRMMTFEEFAKYKIDSIIGFIIVEKGECKKYLNAYCINLICSRVGVEAGIGSLLMGLYLYTIVSHPKLPLSINANATYPSGKATIKYVLIENPNEISSQKPVFSTDDPLIPVQHIGILELAGAYQNAPGLCLYEKFGFKYEPLLLKSDCFTDIENLPMVLSFSSNLKYKHLWKNNIDMIKQILVKISIGYKEPDGTTFDVPLSGRSKVCGIRDRNAQKLYGYLKNLFIFEINKKQSISEDPDNDYKPLYDKLKEISTITQIYIGDIISILITNVLLNNEEVSFDKKNSEKYVIHLTDLYSLINEMSGGKKNKSKNKNKYKTLKKKYSSTKRNRIYHKRHINKKTYKNK
jgi:hypothetical protein